MKLPGKTYWILLAAVAGLPLMASPAHAQYRTGADGHALDANPRVGSGGINVTSSSPTNNINNDIVTDNTTGLYGFHGRVGYTSPTALRIANLPGSFVDQFVAASAGVPGAGPASNYEITAQPYFGATNTAAPPPGFVSNNLNTGFIPAQPTSPSASDFRLGQSPLDSSITTLPLPGELLLPGPVDPTATRTLIQASPLYNVRTWQTDAQGNLLDDQTQTPTGPDATALADQDRILEIRRQLNQTLVPGNVAGPLDAAPLTPIGQGSGAPLQPLGNDNTAITPSAISATAGNLSTGQGSRRYLPPLTAPEKQSTQYKALTALLLKYDSTASTMTDEEANRKFNETVAKMRLLQIQAGLIKPDATTGMNNNGLPTDAGTAIKNKTPLQPVKIPTLSKGVASSALADLLTQAEDQIHRQKYDDAIKTYDEANKAAPNNPLIVIGRAHAELAGSYYKQAEQDIRYAIKQNKALLMAEFSLNDLFGNRFGYVVTQLKQIASDSPKDSTPLFLLGYLSYNADNPAKALAYLDAANKLNGGHDEVIALMKDYWSLNTKAPTTQPAQPALPTK